MNSIKLVKVAYVGNVPKCVFDCGNDKYALCVDLQNDNRVNVILYHYPDGYLGRDLGRIVYEQNHTYVEGEVYIPEDIAPCLNLKRDCRPCCG